MSDKDSDYYDMSEALDELKYSFGAADKALSSAKILGKGLFNVARFSFTEILPRAMESTSKVVLKNENATEEQREKAIQMQSSADEMRQKYKTGRYKEDDDQ